MIEVHSGNNMNENVLYKYDMLFFQEHMSLKKLKKWRNDIEDDTI